MKYKKNKNLKLRLNLIKRAKLTYISYYNCEETK